MIVKKDVQPVRNSEGQLTVRLESLLAMAGFLPTGELSSQYQYYDKGWTTRDGFIFRVSYAKEETSFSDRGPFEEAEIRREARQIIQKAQQWVHYNLRGLQQHVVLAPFEAMLLWKWSQQPEFKLVHHKIGEVAEIRRLTRDSAYDPISHVWAGWEKLGRCRQKVLKSTYYGSPWWRVHQESLEVTFDLGPAVIFTAAGDTKLNTLFYRELHVAD